MHRHASEVMYRLLYAAASACVGLADMVGYRACIQLLFIYVVYICCLYLLACGRIFGQNNDTEQVLFRCTAKELA